MKTTYLSGLVIALGVGLNVFNAAKAAEAAVGLEPVKVTIAATDPIASEFGPSTGLLTVQRTGATTSPLTVFYRTSGSAASPGDYHPLPGSIVIPAGLPWAAILVTAVDDGIAEVDETVVLTLVQPVLTAGSTASSPPYEIGRLNSAAILIKDNDLGNVTLPTLEIRAPDPRAAEPNTPRKITISRIGDVKDALQVFYELVSDPIPPQGLLDQAISDHTLPAVIPAATADADYRSLPGSLTIPSGRRSITLEIQPRDDPLVEGWEHVTIKVIPGALYNINQPDRATVLIQDNDPINLHPRVEIVAPRNGQSFVAPASISISALASDRDGIIRSVEFFVNGRSLGITSANPAGASPVNPFQITWNNVTAGEYTLLAKATDDLGAAESSAPIRIKVTRPARPIVTVRASQAVVLESDPSHPGAFTFTRTGRRDLKLNVQYTIAGHAENGVDYQKIAGPVTIPAGESSATILVVPVPDKALEGRETVTVNLIQPLPDRRGSDLPVEDNYTVGSPRSAAVSIYDELPNEKPKVTLTGPRDGTVFEAGSNIRLAAEAADSDGKIREVTFLVNEKPIGSVIEAPFGWLWNNVPAGRYVLMATTTDDRGGTGESKPVRITVVERGAGTRLIPLGATWKYLDKGTDEGTLWRASAFNDSAWAAGPAQLGYGDGDEATVVNFGPDAEQKFITTYFRHAFQVQDAASFSNLSIRLLRDDGAIVYLNGTEVYRSNMPDGSVHFKSFASATVGDDAEAVYHLTRLDPKLLVNGVNVLAVEVHQRSVTSSDISFDLELIGNPGLPITPRPATLVINSPNNGATLNAPADVRITVTAVDPKGYMSRVGFFANGQPIGASEITFVRAPDPGTPIQHVFDWRNVPAGQFTITALATDSARAIVTSPPVTITVLPPSPVTLRRQSIGNGGGHRVAFQGDAGRLYSIQSSADLVSWVEIGTVECTGGEFEFVDPDSNGARQRFYRALPKDQDDE